MINTSSPLEMVLCCVDYHTRSFLFYSNRKRVAGKPCHGQSSNISSARSFRILENILETLDFSYFFIETAVTIIHCGSTYQKESNTVHFP